MPITVLRHRGRPRREAPEAFDLRRNGWKPDLPARCQRSNRTALPTTDYPTTPTRNRNVYRRIEGLQANVVRPQLPHEFKTRTDNHSVGSQRMATRDENGRSACGSRPHRRIHSAKRGAAHNISRCDNRRHRLGDESAKSIEPKGH